jgi:hypothetical protein
MLIRMASAVERLWSPGAHLVGVVAPREKAIRHTKHSCFSYLQVFLIKRRMLVRLKIAFGQSTSNGHNASTPSSSLLGNNSRI